MDAIGQYAHLHHNFKEMKGWKSFFEDNQQFEVEGIEGHDEYEPRAGEKQDNADAVWRTWFKYSDAVWIDVVVECGIDIIGGSIGDKVLALNECG